MDNLEKAALYAGVLHDLEAVLAGIGDDVTAMATCACLLHELLSRGGAGAAAGRPLPGTARLPGNSLRPRRLRRGCQAACDAGGRRRRAIPGPHRLRSEERRVGKE